MKRALSLLLVLAFVMTNVVFASPVSVKTVENTAEKSETVIETSELFSSNAELQAKSTAPGKNIFNGETTVVSLENEADSTFGSLFTLSTVTSAGVVDNPLSDSINSSAKVLAAVSRVNSDAATVSKTAQDYPDIRFTLPVGIDAARPMYVTFKYYRSNPGTESTDFNSSGECLWMMKNGYSASDIVLSLTQKANTGSWAQTAGFVDFTKQGAHTSSTTSISLRANRYQADTYATTYFYDDLAIIPGYKITYKMNNGTADNYKVSYVKCDLNGPEGGSTYTLDTTVPTDETATFVGWALSDSATADDCITTVDLANEDVTLYAVWDGDPTEEVSTEPVLEYDFNEGKQGWGAWGSITLTHDADNEQIVIERSANAQGAINSPSGIGLTASRARYMVIRLKNNTASADFKFYFKVGTSSYNETNTFHVTMPTAMSDYQEFTVDLTKIATWTDTINSFMVAIYSTSETVEVDNIAFYTALPKKKVEPKLIYDFESGDEGFKTGGSCTAKAENGKYVVNQTISSGYAAFYTPNALGLNPADARYVVVRCMNQSPTKAIHFYYKADTANYSEANSFYVPVNASMKGYKYFMLDTSSYSSFTSATEINQFMITISALGKCYIDSIAFYDENPFPESAPIKEFTFDSDLEGWSAWGINTATWNSSGVMSIGYSGSGQGAVNSPRAIGIDASKAKYMIIRAKNNSAAQSVRIYFQADADNFTESKAFAYPISSNDTDYVDNIYDMSTIATWTDTVDKFMLQFAGSGGTLDVDYIRFYTELPESAKPEEIPEVTYTLNLNASANAITTDGGTVTITPVIETDDETATKTVSFITDNSNALVTKNSDGTLTLTGKINGNIKVTAISDYDKTKTASITIAISGQMDRTAAYEMNVLMFGNSILNHATAPSLGWYGSWGMAASSQDKDYAHRLKYYLTEKYGDENELKMYSVAGFERAIVANDTYDYSSLLGFVKDTIDSMENVPNIVTIQMGENVSTSGLTASQYKNAVVQFVDEIRNQVPGVQIVVCTPFWGSDTSEKVLGMIAAAKELGVRCARLHTLDTNENKAIGLFEHSGVASHPGDTGMDNIAKLIFAELNATLTENMQPEYVVAPSTFTISASSDQITTAFGTLKLNLSVVPTDASLSAKWTSDDENIATVDSEGLVTAKNNGVVTITATSKIKPGVSDTYQITITGQTPAFTLTYNANTSDDVSNMPEVNELAKDNVTLDSTIPVRQYYIFAGWGTTPVSDPSKAVNEIYVNQDTTVYAIWRKADSWDFNIDGYRQGVTVENGFNVYVLDGKLMSIATDTDVASGNVIKFVSPELNLNSDDYNNFVLKMQNTVKNDNTKLKLTVVSDVDTYTFEKNVTTIDPTAYLFDISSVEGTITSFWFTPTNVDCTINIDEMGFTAYTVSYHSEGTVTGMPDNDYALSSKYTVSTKIPVRDGYRFLGWSTSADSYLPVNTVNVNSNVDLYAVWDSNSHWEFGSTESVAEQTATSNIKLLKVEDGIAYYDGSTSSDPIVALNKISLDATKYKTLEIRMAHQLVSADSTGMQVYFTTDTETGLSEGKSVKATVSGQQSDGFVTYTLNMSSNASWKGTIKYLRIDPISGYGNVQLDYVRFTDSTTDNIYVIKGDEVADSARLVGFDKVLLNGGAIAPDGVVTFNTLSVACGNIDCTNGIVKVSGDAELAPDCGYIVYDLSVTPEACPADYTVSGTSFQYTVNSPVSGNYIVKNENKTVFLSYNSNYGYNAIVKVDSDGTATEIDVEGGNYLLSSNTASIRSDGVSGIRFKASVNQGIFDKSVAVSPCEYGFIVSRSSVIGEGNSPTLADVEAGKAIKGTAFSATKHLTFALENDRDIFTCVVKNIPMTSEALCEELVVVPYMTITDGVTVDTIYGESVARSVLSVAEAIFNDGGDDYIANQEYIDNILTIYYGLN